MAETIIQDFLSYIRKQGGNVRSWYVGVAQNPRDRLFADHNVTEHGGAWIHSHDTGSDAIARIVEQRLLNLGCDGGSGGGSRLSRYVYAYLKTPYTNENN